MPSPDSNSSRGEAKRSCWMLWQIEGQPSQTGLFEESLRVGTHPGSAHRHAIGKVLLIRVGRNVRERGGQRADLWLCGSAG